MAPNYEIIAFENQMVFGSSEAETLEHAIKKFMEMIVSIRPPQYSQEEDTMMEKTKKSIIFCDMTFWDKPMIFQLIGKVPSEQYESIERDLKNLYSNRGWLSVSQCEIECQSNAVLIDRQQPS